MFYVDPWGYSTAELIIFLMKNRMNCKHSEALEAFWPGLEGRGFKGLKQEKL